MNLSGINVDVGSVLTGIGSLAKSIRAAITGKEVLDPTKLAELEAQVLQIEAQAMAAQTEINKIEAGHASLFVAGWRPAIGWVCATGLFYHYLGCSLIQWIVAAFKLNIIPPAIETEGLLSIVFALLGLGTMRTFEKIKGAEGNR